jgi:hypothetical protein
MEAKNRKSSQKEPRSRIKLLILLIFKHLYILLLFKNKEVYGPLSVIKKGIGAK